MDTTSEVWSGLDAALHELGMLCGDERRRGRTRETLGKSRQQLNDLVSVTNTAKCHQRHLLPSQAWNRPGIVSEIEGDSGISNSVVNMIHPDVENTENSYSVKACKTVKISEPKECSTLGDSEMYSVCHSEDNAKHDELNVLRMNSRYITGVTIGTFGSSCIVPNKNESYVRATNVHNTPKQGFSLPSLRHHHLRPYEIPWRREERVRTKSETAENEAEIKLTDIVDIPLSYRVVGNDGIINSEFSGSLRKSRSLENFRIADNEIKQLPCHDLETVSNRIQHLHVDE